MRIIIHFTYCLNLRTESESDTSHPPLLLISHTDLIYLFSLETSLELIPIVITLITEEEGSEELLEYVENEMQRLKILLNINIHDVDRFGKRIYRIK